MTALGILWFVLIAVLICGYFVLDGFDLGAGVLYPFLARDERDRAVVRRAIGPVWDGNEVWLLTAGGALFAAFAPAYATSFSGFYLAIMLVLFGLIVRATALEFRAHDPAWAKLWDALFFVGSLLPALLFGVAVGNVVQGLPLNAAGDYTGTFFDLLSPFALSCGVLGLVHMLVQGSSWIALKAPQGSGLKARATILRGRLAIADLVVFALVGLQFMMVVVPNSAVRPGLCGLAGGGCRLQGYLPQGGHRPPRAGEPGLRGSGGHVCRLAVPQPYPCDLAGVLHHHRQRRLERPYADRHDRHRLHWRSAGAGVSRDLLPHL